MTKTTIDKTRAFEMTIDIAASPEDVWRALTDAQELVRWFPLAARVTPGPGGSMRWSWGEDWSWETRIDAWDPPRLLRLVDETARPFDAEGRPLPGGAAEPARIALEFTLETVAGKTRVRLVHSGFGHGAAWDDEFDGISSGWQFELRSLRYYLERHRGRERHAAWVHVTTAEPRAAAWAQLTGPGGFPVTPASPKVGGPYSVALPGGERLSGTVELFAPGQQLSGTARELGDGIFRLETWRAGGKTGVMVWLVTYSGDPARISAFERQAREVLKRVFVGS
jgi:uncharacterized protein YndB with AHSA1/START domain